MRSSNISDSEAERRKYREVKSMSDGLVVSKEALRNTINFDTSENDDNLILCIFLEKIRFHHSVT